MWIVCFELHEEFRQFRSQVFKMFNDNGRNDESVYVVFEVSKQNHIQFPANKQWQNWSERSKDELTRWVSGIVGNFASILSFAFQAWDDDGDDFKNIAINGSHESEVFVLV